ncbi:protein BANP-like [Glandiceps talaboti]
MSEEQQLSDTDALQMAVNQITNSQEEEQLIDEPPAKRQKTSQDDNMTEAASIKQILFNVNKAICLRLDSIENKLETINLRCKYLEEKLDNMSESNFPKVISDQGGGGESTTPTQQRGTPRSANNSNYTPRRQSTIIIGLPQNQQGQETQPESQEESAGSQISNTSNPSSPQPNLGSNVTLITLNSEDDYPNGTWLGDESNIEMRVRCHVTPSDMLHIHSTCRTPEKMALTLLDYIFDRETQACSNISGMGKHGKKQLDPLMIYGIRCHLIHKFGVNETDWHRIKQNMDSKCRTAFRRKQKGQSLSVKAFSRKSPTATTIYTHQIQSLRSDDGEEMQEQAVTQAAVEQMQQMHQQIHIQHVADGEAVVQQTIPEQVTVQVTQSGEAIHIQQGDTIQIQQGEAVAIPQGEIQIAVNPDVQVHEVQQIQGGEIQIQPTTVQLQQTQ